MPGFGIDPNPREPLSPKDGWAERRAVIDRVPHYTVNQLKALNAAVTMTAIKDALGAKVDPQLTKGIMEVRLFLNGLRADAENEAAANAQEEPAAHPSGWRTRAVSSGRPRRRPRGH